MSVGAIRDARRRVRRADQRCGALVALIVVYGGYEAGLQSFADALQPAIEEATGGAGSLPEGESADEFALSAGALFARRDRGVDAADVLRQSLRRRALGALSHRLRRPWPDMPTRFLLPGRLAPSPSPRWRRPSPCRRPPAIFAWIVAGALGAAFVLQGLAVLHALSRGLPMRPLMLVALYFCCVIAPNWTPAGDRALGLIDELRGDCALARAARRSKI